MAIVNRETTHYPDGTMSVKEQIDDGKYIGTKKARFNNGDFITLFQEAVITISTQYDLTKGAHKVFLYLVGITEVCNEIKLPLNELATVLKIDKGNIYRHLKELEDLNILVRDRKTKYVRLNYNVGYKGKIKEFPQLKFTDSKIGTKISNQQQLELDNKARETHETLMLESHNELKILSRPIDKNEIKKLELLVKQGKETLDAFYGAQKQPKKRLSTLKQ